MRDGLLLLAAPDRAGRDRAEALAQAARRLSLQPRIVVSNSGEGLCRPGPQGGAGLLFALACSETLAPAAARLNALHGAGGFAPEVVATLADRAAGLSYLSKLLGLPSRPRLLPGEPCAATALLLLTPGRAAICDGTPDALPRRLLRLHRQNWGRGFLQVQCRRDGRGRLHLAAIGLAAPDVSPQAAYRLLCTLLFDQPFEAASAVGGTPIRE